MSHFTTLKTKIKHRKPLCKALGMIGYPVFLDEMLDNPDDHQHAQVFVDVKVTDEVGFKYNKETETFELIAELDAWDMEIMEVPARRFIDKVTQQYAIELITDEAQAKGFTIEEQTVNSRNEVELVITKY